jgi:hypothetical protein
MPRHDRTKGYVTGQVEAITGDVQVWKVRVKHASSPHNGKWLAVASVHDNVQLAQGLVVNFVIGFVEDGSGKESLRAIDVIVQPPTLTTVKGEKSEIKTEERGYCAS